MNITPEQARLDRDRARLRTVLMLLGVSKETTDDAEAKMVEAAASYPDGGLMFTHGPYAEPESLPSATFHNLIAMWWQDNDYGSQFNELLWERS